MWQKVLGFMFKFVIASRIDKIATLICDLLKALEDGKITDDEKVILKKRAYDVLFDLEIEEQVIQKLKK